MRSSTPGHWQRFWEQADRLELDDVYGTDGRMVREITGIYDGDPAGLRGPGGDQFAVQGFEEAGVDHRRRDSLLLKSGGGRQGRVNPVADRHRLP